MQPRIVPPDQAHTLSLYDVQFRYGLGGGETDGGIALLEVTVPPRTLVKPHAHSHEDEFSLVLSGKIGVRLAEEITEEVPAGSWLAKPRSIPHAMWNVSDEPARVLEVVMPAGLERYFEELAPILQEHGPEWTQRYSALAEAYGLTILDDWTDELQERYGITL
jgi:quercetin dioxygenase-like cupin family protein